MTGVSGSLHPEWDLMYRQGLTVKQIAELCGVVRGTVDRHIHIQKQRDPSLRTAHDRNLPASKTHPIGKVWQANLEGVKEFRDKHGRYPTSKNPDHVARRLARWLTDQRARLKAGTLSQAKQDLMAGLPDWAANQRPRIDAERWEQRLGQLRTFRVENQRWPRHRASASEHERVLGVWLHSRRQEAIRDAMPKDQRTALDREIPGWNTWKPRDRILLTRPKGTP
ncbi:helicase associated domain-containing protein [Arthrobacter sp. R4-81]